MSDLVVLYSLESVCKSWHAHDDGHTFANNMREGETDYTSPDCYYSIHHCQTAYRVRSINNLIKTY